VVVAHQSPHDGAYAQRLIDHIISSRRTHLPIRSLSGEMYSVRLARELSDGVEILIVAIHVLVRLLGHGDIRQQ